MEKISQPTDDFHGYSSDGEAVSANNTTRRQLAEDLAAKPTPIRSASVRTRNSYSESTESFIPVQLPTPTRRKYFRARAGTDPLQAVPEDDILERQRSLDWDNLGENDQLLVTQRLDLTRRWSTDTLFSVPIDRSETGTVHDADDDDTSDSDDFLSPTDSEPPPAVNMDPPDLAGWRRKVARAILEAEEDILPFAGKKVSLSCITRLCSLASSLKKDLQNAHLELAADEEYKERQLELSATCRAKLVTFLVDMEMSRAAYEEAEQSRQQKNDAGVKQPVVVRKIQAATEELYKLKAGYAETASKMPTSDSELFEKIETIKMLDEQFAALAVDVKDMSKLALENNLFKEEGTMDGVMAAVKTMKDISNKNLFDWRKEAGIWGESKKRGPVRTDLKLPAFTAGMAAKSTIYEFERDWKEYKGAMEYSKEEALKTLKLAVQPPSRADICNFRSEEEIFEYLKKHHGNPMVLLNAREKEIRAWSHCAGTDMARRDWLIMAKSKLQATVKMCKDQEIERYMHFSSIANEIQCKFPADMTKDFKRILKKHLTPSGILEKEIIIGLLIEFLEDKILDCTLGVNLDIVNYLGTAREEPVKNDSGGTGSGTGGGAKNNRFGQRGAHHSGQQPPGTGTHQQRDGKKSRSSIIDDKCLSCGSNHTHLFYCEHYISADPNQRFAMVRKQQACGRCLGMRVKLSGKKDEWYSRHEKYCKTDFFCEEGTCHGRPQKNQVHITICRNHTRENKDKEADFISSLDLTLFPINLQRSGFSFFLLAVSHLKTAPPSPCHASGKYEVVQHVVKDGQVYEVLPDVNDTAVFMMQQIPAAADMRQPLLVFYDSGCSGAGISDRGCSLLDTTNVRPGPTVLDVAGGRSLEIPFGDERFSIQLEEQLKLATITALHMPNITANFPAVSVSAAWEELQFEFGKLFSGGKLPAADTTIGGGPVDLLIGIKYLKYFPELVFSLPSGLSVYRAKFKSASGNQAILGGPHAAWNWAADRAGHMNPRAFLTSEARAWCVEGAWVRINTGNFPWSDPYDDNPAEWPPRAAANACCNVASKRPPADLWQVETVGTESPYRCVECRKCQQCKRGDILEETSFREEAEQAMIDASVVLDVTKRELRASLPFTADPVTSLTANRFIAEKVFRAQLELFKRRPDMKDDTLKSHAKLVQRGHVKKLKELLPAEKEVFHKIPGPGYYIPWRIVHNEGSLSTPCRMVFDASSKTPGGSSLNGVLAKGQNRLVKLQSLLAKFRQGKAAVSADISMAYNGTKLWPEYYKFQCYLWKEDLEEDRPTEDMCVITLIYGVKPSGAQCQVSIEKLANHYLDLGKHIVAANMLKDDVYVDDLMASKNSVEECYLAAIGVEEILDIGSMGVKAFTFSGQAPDEAVSADGLHVGLGGYLWRPLTDLLLLDIGPPRLGKAKRGKMPEPITGDFGQALQKCFTRRVLGGIVARVFDPLGLATPVTAHLKLCLHDLCQRNLDWDDPVPLELLSVWTENMMAIQDLKHVLFNRAVVPADAVGEQIDLVVAVDASQHIGAAAIYARTLKKDGSFSCQLMMARSKIMANSTIPKAELRAAVMGAVSAQIVMKNLGDKFGSIIYVTDSAVGLHWIQQDDRPLKTAVRNAVIEVLRFSKREEWFHIEGELNIADLATRKTTVSEIGHNTEWQLGKEWMTLPVADMPIRTAAQLVLSGEEKRLAVSETRAKDIHGHVIQVSVEKLADQYAHSHYIIDPCRFPWTKVVRVLGLVMRFIKKLRTAVMSRLQPGQPGTGIAPDARCPVGVVLEPEELAKAEDYYFRLATLEVKEFSKPALFKHCSEERDGILYFTGRLLDSKDIHAMENVMFDLNPASFCKPVVDRHSPVAHSIMVETHWATVSHLNATCTFRESLSKAYILGGRELAQEVRESCVFCRRFKARLQQVEMGKLHETRLTIAPAFTICQVDLLGPFLAQCEHNHRSSVKIWGVIFKDPGSGAVFVHAMSSCSTSSFLLAYTRFAARFCHPQKLYPDEGSQLLKACRDMEISWIDVSTTLNALHGVGVEFEPCPVGGHNFHGMVERSVREVKKLFSTVYAGVKLDVLGYETAFNWVSNELNNLPLCLGTKYRDLDHLDLLTPNRLIHGRANRRAMSGCCLLDKPSVMLQRMEDVFESWWKAWFEEKLADYVLKPAKWYKTDRNLECGDIVVFHKTGDEQVIGQPIWRIGRVIEVENSQQDSLVRAVTIEYKNALEAVFRTTRRAARQVAVLHREDELEMVQELNLAARKAESMIRDQSLYLDRQSAVFRNVKKCERCVPPYLCGRHGSFFLNHPYLDAGCGGPDESVSRSVHVQCDDALCSVLRIHEDPWDSDV